MKRISVVIPTLNEEEHLKQALTSLEKQTFKDFEVIVSDSYSWDRTRQIANEFGAKVVVGPQNGPGAARNLGAKLANGEILLFLDADTYLESSYALEMLNRQFSDKDVVGGGFAYKPHGAGLPDKLMFFVANTASVIGSKINFPFTPGFALFMRKDIFEKVGGFNEDIPCCEDLEISLRVARKNLGKSVHINSIALNSARRFRKAGVFNTASIYLKSMFYLYLTGNVTREQIKIKPASAY